MPFFRWDELEKNLITPEYSSATGPNIRGEKIEVGLFFYPAGTHAMTHIHPNEQIQVLLKGKAKYRVGTEERVVGVGEAVLIPENTEHEVQILEDVELINCKNVVAGWSVKHARWEK